MLFCIICGEKKGKEKCVGNEGRPLVFQFQNRFKPKTPPFALASFRLRLSYAERA